MKVLFINTTDISGGAAIAAYRLHKGLQAIGANSQMLVQLKFKNEANIIGPSSFLRKGLSYIRPRLDVMPLRFYKQRKPIIFSPAIMLDNLCKKISAINPDVVHLHWIAGGFIRIETLKNIKKPLVWTLHDSWPFTGGCHLPFDCKRYQESCGECPTLGSNSGRDLSRWIWKRKSKAWRELNFTVVTPSRWLADCARSSSLFQNRRILVIPNGINENRFKPLDKKTARDILSLPNDKKLILFGAMESVATSYKGFHLLIPALQRVAGNGWRDKAELLIFGASEPPDKPELGLKPNYLGQFNDEITMSILYAAADVFVLPSVQENLPNVIMEAMACGTPCVAFNVGGISDMIEHEHTGYIARPFETEDMAKGITWLLEKEERWHALSAESRAKVEREYTLEKVARQYVELYNELRAR